MNTDALRVLVIAAYTIIAIGSIIFAFYMRRSSKRILIENIQALSEIGAQLQAAKERVRVLEEAKQALQQSRMEHASENLEEQG